MGSCIGLPHHEKIVHYVKNSKKTLTGHNGYNADVFLISKLFLKAKAESPLLFWYRCWALV